MNSRLKINGAILIVFCVISGLFFLGISGFNILSGLRAYVGGEGLWSKGEQGATYHLTQYIFTRDVQHYELFLDSLKVPLGDKVARLELEKANPVDAIVFQGLAAGGNHPDDIPTMIKLYKRFKNLKHIKNALEQWEIGDGLLEKLIKVGEETRLLIEGNSLSQAEAVPLLTRIDALHRQLVVAENKFSYHMSAAARWSATMVFFTMLVFTVAGSIICFIMLRLVAGIISELKDKNEQLRIQSDKEIAIRDALKKSEERFRRLAENAPDMIYRMSLPDGYYEYVSPAAMKICGYTPEEFYRQPLLIRKIIHPDWLDYFASQWKSLLEGELPPFYEYQIITKEGQHCWINQRNVIVRDDAGTPIAIEGIVTDITAKKSWEAEREQMEFELRQAHKMEAIGTLAGGIAHDFNNILTAILGYSDLARDTIPHGNPAKEHVLEVLKAGNRAKNLVKQILAFSRKDAQKRSPLQIHLLVQETLKLLRASIPSTIKFQQNIDTHCGNILGNPTQIHQVLVNILTNASHAMEEKGGILGIELIPAVLTAEDLENEPNLQPGPYIKFSVRDTGGGIAKEHLDRIFDPYFTTKEIGKGTGMGLAVVLGIVKGHDGMITVKSRPGEGSVFSVYFPKIAEKTRSEPEDSGPLPAGTEKILVVDDEASIAAMVRRKVESLGYQVTATTSSMEALELFRSQPDSFDLVITDQTMPELTGEQLAIEMMNIRPDIPVIMCTGYSPQIDAAKANALGIRAFIMKPVDHGTLAKIIRKVLDNDPPSDMEMH